MRRLLLCGLVLVSCTTSPPSATGPSGSPPTSPAESRSTSPSADPEPPSRSPYVRPCESRVSGVLGAGWRTQAVVAGPVVFLGSRGYADDPASLFAAPSDRATVQKVLLVVSGGRPVVLAVRHPSAALFYDPNRWRDRNVVAFRLGDRRVRFEPCGGGLATQFNGGFLVRGPTCVPVEVRAGDPEPIVATLSFGAGDCP